MTYVKSILPGVFPGIYSDHKKAYSNIQVPNCWNNMLYAHILELDDHLNELSIREIDIADHLGEPLNSHFQSSMEPMKWAIGG